VIALGVISILTMLLGAMRSKPGVAGVGLLAGTAYIALSVGV
jgi:hypothetical protein